MNPGRFSLTVYKAGSPASLRPSRLCSCIVENEAARARRRRARGKPHAHCRAHDNRKAVAEPSANRAGHLEMAKSQSPLACARSPASPNNRDFRRAIGHCGRKRIIDDRVDEAPSRSVFPSVSIEMRARIWGLTAHTPGAAHSVIPRMIRTHRFATGKHIGSRPNEIRPTIEPVSIGHVERRHPRSHLGEEMVVCGDLPESDGSGREPPLARRVTAPRQQKSTRLTTPKAPLTRRRFCSAPCWPRQTTLSKQRVPQLADPLSLVCSCLAPVTATINLNSNYRKTSIIFDNLSRRFY